MGKNKNKKNEKLVRKVLGLEPNFIVPMESHDFDLTAIDDELAALDRQRAHDTSFFGISSTLQSSRVPRFQPVRPQLNGYGEEQFSMILDDQLWQSGSVENEFRLKEMGIDYVINMCGDAPIRSDRFGYPFVEVRYPIGDDKISKVNLNHIHSIAEAAAEHIRRGGKVLSHCQMGWNRSGLVTALIMMDLGFEGDVVAHIRAKRSKNALGNREFAAYIYSLQGSVQTELSKV